MAVRCPLCHNEFDVTLFEFQVVVRCVCGNVVTLQHNEPLKRPDCLISEEERSISEIKDFADRISFLIVNTDYPGLDIEVEKKKLREKTERLFPDKIHLYDLIYETRFKRLHEQFRGVVG